MNNFIELHNCKRDNFPKMLINVNHIASVEEFGGMSIICLNAPKCEGVIVMETYEKVKQLIIMSNPTANKDGEC